MCTGFILYIIQSAFVFCAPSGGSLTPVKLQSGSVGSTVHHFGLPSPTVSICICILLLFRCAYHAFFYRQAFVPAVLREELSRAPIPVYFKNSSSMRGKTYNHLVYILHSISSYQGGVYSTTPWSVEKLET